MLITSVADDRLDPFRSIKGKGDRGDGTFVAESELVLDRMLESSYKIRSILITPPRAARIHELIERAQHQRAEPFDVYVAERDVIDAVVGYPLHRGVIVLAERQPLVPVAQVLARARTIVVLEDVADPDNIGAVFRHAAGFGVDAIIVHGHTADPLYRRTIRVAMGWTLTIPYARTSVEDGPIALLLNDAGFASFALTPDPSADSLVDVVRGLSSSSRIAFLLGAEGPGLRPETMVQSRRVRIPMSEGIDSLNVATSGAIALFALTSAQPSRLERTAVR